MSRLVSRGNVVRLVLILFVAAFITGVYVAAPSHVGGRVPVVLAAEGGVVDVQINDGSGSFVFTPETCHTQIATLSACTSTVQVSNVGGAESTEFEYSIEVWADSDGVDRGDAGSAGDELSDCFVVSLDRTATTGTAASAGPRWGFPLQLEQSEAWVAGVAVKDDNLCQGATTTVIISVVASDIPGFFDDLKTPVVPVVPTEAVEPTAAPSVEATAAPPQPTQAEEAVVQEPKEGEEPSPAETPPPPTVTRTPVPPTSTPVRSTPVATTVVTPAPTEPPSPTPTKESLPGRADGPNFLVQRIPGPSAISTDVEVIATNITLSLLALTVILVATTMFNATLEENAVELGLLMNRVRGGAGTVGKTLGWVEQADVNDHPGWLGTMIKPLIIVAITAMIYAALEPNFGFNDETLILVVALMAGIAMSTFIFEGGQVFWSSKRYATPAAMRIYPLAIFIAIASVLLTRFADLHPGVIFGFVTAAAIFPRAGALNPRDRGMIVLVPLASLLVMAMIAFFLIEPFRAYSEAHDGVWYALPETVAISLFVGGAQGALLILIPVTFNDGEKIWKWNKLIWFALALPASFMFFHVMVNSEGDFGDVSAGGGMTLLIISGVVLAVSFLTWSYFRVKHMRAGGDD